MPGDLFCGTSGFSYQEWKGPFYPPELRERGFLRYYAERLPTVEINNTFYRMPKAEILARWAGDVPPDFRFALKAPQRITHRERLVGSGDSVAYFWKQAAALGPHAGPILFQLPPFLRADLDRLRGFLAALPPGMRAAFEFRHESWSEPAVVDALRDAGAALCAADLDDGPDPALTPTADFGYLRLRRATYRDDQLAAWADRIAQQPWREVFIFFKHEDAGAAPELALRLAGLASSRGGARAPGEAAAWE